MVCYNPPIAPHHYVQFEPPVLLNGSNTFGAWRDQVDPLLWFMSCRVPTLVPGSRSNTPTLPLVEGYSCLVSGFQPCGTLQSCHPTTHREVRSVSCPPPHHLQECRSEPPLSASVGGGSVPPQPSGGTAQECSNAAVVVPRSTRFSRRFARFPVEPPASARRRHQPGERESRGAQVPRGAFAFASELSNELSVRGDKNNAMHCRKKPRDALSVCTIAYHNLV